MNQTSKTNKLSRAAQTLAATLALIFALAAPALASVASEQQEGAQTLSAVHAGKLKASGLSSTQYERVGEYLMSQALSSTASHQRMNSLMDQMMGSTAVDQMHVYLGQRYLGNNAQIPDRYAPMYGLIGMMTGYRGNSIAGMMSGYLNSQSHGTGAHGTMMGTATGTGTGMMGYYGTQSSASSESGWPTGAIVVTAVLAALLLGGVVALAVPMLRRRSGRGPRGGPASTPAS